MSEKSESADDLTDKPRVEEHLVVPQGKSAELSEGQLEAVSGGASHVVGVTPAPPSPIPIPYPNLSKL